MTRLFEILPMLAIIFVICHIHAERFAENKAIGFWFHASWACVYAVPAALLAWQFHSWWLAGAFTLERFVLYNPILNYMRHLGIFYLGHAANGSWWDRVEIWWGKAYPFVWVAGIVGFITIQFFL